MPLGHSLFRPEHPQVQLRHRIQETMMSLDIISFTYYIAAMDTMPPEKHLGFLINDVARLLRRAFDQAAQGCALTRAQWQVLAFLYHNEGSNQAVVAEALDVEPITLSRHIDRLEALGYVVRLPDPSDRRARRLQLTATVKPHLQAMKAIANDVLKSALEGMDEAETEQLANALTLMRANMARYGAESSDDCAAPLAVGAAIRLEEKSVS